jgi:Putative Actinobacterial Holin-X, holin superfamily III
MRVITEHERKAVYEQKPIGQVVDELKTEAKDFLNTRLQMLMQEMKSKMNVWKLAIPMFVIAGVVAWVAFLVLTFALVSFLAGVFQPSNYAWCFGGLIVGAFYCFVAAGVFFLAQKEMSSAGLAPMRTLRVLKEDQIWMQNEARSQV